MDFPGRSVSLKLESVGELPTLGLILEEAVDLGDGTVEGNNGEAVIRSVENQVLAHDSQADEAEITTRFSVRSADIDAGQARTEVSMAQQEYESKNWQALEDIASSMQAAVRC